jgi:hypothetical protein
MNPELYFKGMVSKDDKVTVPVYAKGIKDLGSFNITLQYDKSVMMLTDPPAALHCGKGTLGVNNTIQGTVKFGWFTWPGISLPDDSILFEMGFTKIKDGVSAIAFVDDFGLSNDKWETLITEYTNATITLKTKVMERLTLNYNVVERNLKVGDKLQIPIKYTGNEGVTAVSLVLRYDNNFVKITGVSCDKATLSTGKPVANELRIGWYDQTPIRDFTINIACEVLENGSLGDVVKLILYEADPINPLNKYAGEDYNPMEGVILDTVYYQQKSTVAARKAAQGYISNPINKSCANCKNYDGTSKCMPGNFVVAKKGVCDLHL